MLSPALVLSLLTAAASPLTTVSERSGFKKTGRYDEVQTLCHAFEAAYPKQVRCITFGTTPEQRPMLALVASADGTLTAEQARRAKRPVVMAQGGIHAGEIDGKDAGFLALRELLDGTAPKELLQKVTFVFVPVFNIDGHERFGPNNRPNQRGPEEMGWRVSAQNLNLNRDYVKAEAPEMQAMLRLLREWDPILYLDLHVTDGAKFQHDVAVMIQPTRVGPRPLRDEGLKAEAQVFARLRAQGHLPLEFYPSFNESDNPASGFSLGVAPPRFSQAYWALHNRLGVLVETHSWRDYPHRVRTTHDVLMAFFEAAVARGQEWLEAAQEADAAEAKARGGKVVLRWAANPQKSRQLEFLGYAYTREPSDVSGQLWTRYDESRPEVWRVPYYSELEPKLEVTAPGAGWLVPVAYAKLVADKLSLHGFRYQVLSSPRTAKVQAFRATEVKFAATPFESRQQTTVAGKWEDDQVELRAGALFVPAAQPGRVLLIDLLDPRSPDSMVTWGFFNAVFEQKEYIEDYVLEPFARDLLKRDPKVRAEFEQKLKSDPQFAGSPQARLRFFALRHPAWDQTFNRYPVFRTDRAPSP